MGRARKEGKRNIGRKGQRHDRLWWWARPLCRRRGRFVERGRLRAKPSIPVWGGGGNEGQRILKTLDHSIFMWRQSWPGAGGTKFRPTPSPNCPFRHGIYDSSSLLAPGRPTDQTSMETLETPKVSDLNAATENSDTALS